MTQYNQILDKGKDQRDALQPAASGAAGGARAVRAGVPAAIVMDCYGTVQHCSSSLAGLFQTRPRFLIGRHIRELIPNLPLSAATPGYNAAYATFWAAKGEQGGFEGVDSYGKTFGLRIALIGPKLRAWRQQARARRKDHAPSVAHHSLLYCLCQPE